MLSAKEIKFISDVYKGFNPNAKDYKELRPFEMFEIYSFFSNCTQTVRRLEATELLHRELYNIVNYRSECTFMRWLTGLKNRMLGE